MKRKLGYTTGVFDLFHVGHLNLLQSAKSLCDRLIVGVTNDELSEKHKGKRPIIPFVERIEIVQNIKCVDAVVEQWSMDKLEAWNKLKFDIMFVGDDWKGTEKWNKIESQFSEVGVEIVFFPYTMHTSSTIIRDVLERVASALR